MQALQGFLTSIGITFQIVQGQGHLSVEVEGLRCGA